ncbi:MAG: VanZ family protein [Chitinispirillaceae bacterium]|nr:VanZ family protein [Chitinispirillaceae bacterium]
MSENQYSIYKILRIRFPIPLNQKSFYFVAFFLLFGMLAACLRPFGIRPVNKVVIKQERAGAYIQEPGIIFSDPFSVPEALDSCRIDLVITPDPQEKDGIRSIAVIVDSGWNERLLIAQWKSALLFWRMRHDRRIPEYELICQKIFLPGKRTGISVVQAGEKCAVYIDSILKQRIEQPLFQPAYGGPLRICMGNSPIMNRNWEGTIHSLRFQCGPDVVRFTPDTSANRTTLHVRFHMPKRMPFVATPFLTMPEEYRTSLGYVLDLIFNVLGFIPWGFAVGLFFLMIRRRSVAAAMVGAVLSGLLISLCIEGMQTFLYGRSSQMTDLILNTLGSMSGALVVRWGRAFFARFIRIPAR